MGGGIGDEREGRGGEASNNLDRRVARYGGRSKQTYRLRCPQERVKIRSRVGLGHIIRDIPAVPCRHRQLPDVHGHTVPPLHVPIVHMPFAGRPHLKRQVRIALVQALVDLYPGAKRGKERRKEKGKEGNASTLPNQKNQK